MLQHAATSLGERPRSAGAELARRGSSFSNFQTNGRHVHMGLFGFLKKLFGGVSPKDLTFEETIGAGDQQPPSSLQNRDLDYRVEDLPTPTIDPSTGFSIDTNNVPNSGPAGSVHPPGDVPPVVNRQGSSGRSANKQQQNRSLSGLDTDKFAPLTDDEAMAATNQEGWRTAYYDSLRVIPPEDLARIRVIDRTMVGYGLISPDELAEIHEVGREMDVYKGGQGVVFNAGERAVQQAREDRSRLKQQKKEEAEAKRAKRKEQIEYRHATDIIFLGRGVSRGLADRRSNIEKLESHGLPMLSAPADVANAMGITVSKLRWLAFHNEAPTRIHYTMFDVAKKSGGKRQLAAPLPELAKAQQWILHEVLEKCTLHNAAHGFVRERSTATNAAPHVGSDVVLNMDLKDFFPSITFHRVGGLLRGMGYSPAVATVLALLGTECPRRIVGFDGERYYAATGERQLPQGACTSPAFSNLIARRLDKRLSALADRLGWRYTRYADDLTFSCNGQEASQLLAYLMARIRHIVDDEGFAVNHAKTRVLRRSARQSVTGVVVNDKPSVPRPLIRKIRAILHNAKRTGLAAQNREQRPNFEAWLRGMIAYIEMLNPDKGRQLRGAYESLKVR